MRQEKKIRGIQLVYDDLGKGSPILFIHGQPFNRTMWRYQVQPFTQRHRLIIPDLRGYGESGTTPGRVLLDEIALDLLHLLESLQMQQAIIVGLSMGGQIALELFRLRPAMITKLILCDTDARSETEESYQLRLDMADEIEKMGMHTYTDKRISLFMSPDTFLRQPVVAQHLREMMTTTSAVGSAAAQRGRAERRDHSTILSDIRCPTLIVVGNEDLFTPLGAAQYMHQRIAGSKLAVIRGAGHLPSMEQPDAFNRVLMDFIEETPLSVA